MIFYNHRCFFLCLELSPFDYISNETMLLEALKWNFIYFSR